jgi:hypothetical protein
VGCKNNVSSHVTGCRYPGNPHTHSHGQFRNSQQMLSTAESFLHGVNSRLRMEHKQPQGRIISNMSETLRAAMFELLLSNTGKIA